MEQRFIVKLRSNKTDKRYIDECLIKDRLSDQTSFTLPRLSIIDDIEQGKYSYFTYTNKGDKMPVTVIVVKKQKYLKTMRNDTEADNLGNFPEY